MIFLLITEKLTLSRNRIPAIPGSISQLIRLTSLDISHNSLHSLPVSLSSLSSLSSLMVEGNPLSLVSPEIISALKWNEIGPAKNLLSQSLTKWQKYRVRIIFN